MIITFAIVGLILLVVLLYGIFHKSNSTEFDHIKDVVVPVITPLVIVTLGFVFTLQSEKRQRHETELQYQQQRADQQIAVMREMMVSQDRRDISTILAIDTQMAVHVRRLQANSPIVDSYTNFDEEALFFFFGLHQMAMVNVWASKGNVIFPRLWMANAFEALLENVLTNVYGTDYMDPALNPKIEAVMYKYFAGTVSDNSGTKTPPLLMDFHNLLENNQDARLTREETDTLVYAFHQFQNRLHKNKIRKDELINDLLAANGLVEYSYLGIFSDWYQLPQYSADFIPIELPLPSMPPPAFIETFKDYPDNGEVGTNSWKWILKMASPQSLKP